MYLFLVEHAPWGPGLGPSSRSAVEAGYCCCFCCYCRVGRTGRAGDKEGVAWTLLDAKKDTHFAGLLVNSLSLSGQEVPRQLHELAMKVGGS